MQSIIVKNAIFEKKKLMLSIAALLAVMGLIFALRTLSARAGREAARRRAADHMPTPSPTPCFRPTSPASAGSGPDDPYNAADFTGPEDFYEENRDAFDNIDDAEAYWQENS